MIEALASLDDAVRDMLCEDFPAQLHAMRQMMNAQDWEEARRIAHDINGTAAFCRLETLRRTALTLEQALLTPPPHESIHHEFQLAASEVLAAIGMHAK